MEMRVRCDRLSVDYGSGTEQVRALRNVSLELAGGEFVSLVGPSGCGKTTLLRALAGFVPATTGYVEHSGTAPAGSIGLVPHDHSLFPWMTAMENAAFALEMQGMRREEREGAALRVLRRFGLEGRERSYPHQLSAGMRQRVAVARAFLSGASLLLMDEPFGALDAFTRQRLQQELWEEWMANRPTVLFVTHDVDEAISLSSRILVMQSRPSGVLAEFEVPSQHPRSFPPALTGRLGALKENIHAVLGLTREKAMAMNC